MSPMGMRRGTVRVAIWVLVFCAGVPLQAGAQQWKVDPRIELAGQYVSNYLLNASDDPQISVAGASLDAAVQLQRLTSTTSIMFTPRIWSTYFPSHTEENANDQYAYLALGHVGQTHAEGLTVDYRRQSLLNETLPGAGAQTTDQLGQPARGNDVGLFFNHSRQVLWLIDPSAQYDLTARQRLDFKAEYLDTTYSEGARTDYVPYTNLVAMAGYEFLWSPRSTLTLRVRGTKFSPDAGANSTTVGTEIEWLTRWSETARYYVRAGIDHTNYDSSTQFNTPSSTANSGSFGAGVNWAFQVTSIFLDGMRNVAPSAGGYAVLQDQLRLRAERRFTQLLAGFFTLSALRNDSQGGESTNQSDRRYAQANLGVEWRLRKEWTVTTNYGFVWQHYVNLGGAAHSNQVNVSVIWQPHRPEGGPAVTVGY